MLRKIIALLVIITLLVIGLFYGYQRGHVHTLKLDEHNVELINSKGGVERISNSGNKVFEYSSKEQNFNVKYRSDTFTINGKVYKTETSSDNVKIVDGVIYINGNKK